MSTLADVRPGDIMFSKRLKPEAVAILVWAGQLALGELGYPQHVGVVVEGGRLVQAMPRGAEVVTLDARHWTGDVEFIRPAYVPGQAGMVALAALGYVGTPYSFLDYAAIAAHRVTGRGYVPIEERTRLERYVASTGHMICSQLGDKAMGDAGWHNFQDRLPQDVTPAALHTKMMADGPALVLGMGR